MEFAIKVFTPGHREMIYQAFEKTFARYEAPVLLHKETQLKAWENEGVNWDLSYGAYYEEELVGFILHGFKGERLKNVVTGVLPEFRGKGLLKKMYLDILPKLKDQGFDRIYLNVLTQNGNAIAAYSKVGFRITQRFNSEFEMMKFI